ncbi:unnamed protein product [Triticum turgidum subsp. durum]|uniref:Importin N-terminal domain-containing protein n=1 Tax=Triticum turgidum subsp. durum TaxID=4567 RepID=A0A9R1AUN9_TRITD|nr:unnamed protein product [Triticum turgidum subsp. durum]
MDITKLLLDAQHHDDGIRSVAEAELKRLEEHDLPGFLLRLSSELSSDQSPPESRRLVGTILKDSLGSSDGNVHPINDPLVHRWLSLDPSIRSTIKESSLMTALASPVADARRTSSQVITKLEFIGDWPDLLGRLLGNAAQRQGVPPLKQQAALEALEHVFKDRHKYLQPDQVDDVLNFLIVEASRVEDDISRDVRLAAIRALRNVLWYEVWRICKDDDEGTRIMATVLNAAKSEETEFRQATFECLAAIASRDHTKLEPYMETILGLTTQAFKGGVESVALASIEFWSAACEREIRLQYYMRDDDDDNDDDVVALDCGFLGKPLSALAPLLLETLLKQDEDDSLKDLSTCFIYKAGRKPFSVKDLSTSAMECLGLAAKSIGDAIVPPVMRFFGANIIASDWQSRKAATFALGFILEGPSLEKLAPVIDLLLDMMKDPNMQVRETAARTLQRVFELRHSQASSNRIVTNANLPRIMDVLIESTKDVSEVSDKVCGAIYYLALGYDEDAQSKSKSNSSELSPFVEPVIDALLSASEPTPLGLPACASAYEALSEIVRVGSTREFEASLAIRVVMPRILRRLNVVVNHDGVVISSGDSKMNRGLLEFLLCGLVQLIIEKMGSWDIIERSALRDSAQYVLLLLCRVLTSSDCPGARHKAALAIGALAHAIGPDFGEHMPMLLQHFTAKRLSPTYLHVMCDICHVLGDKVAVPWSDQIMDVLYKGMSDDVALIPSIVACFGEIALAIGRNFERYLETVMNMLKEAANNGKYRAHVSEVGKVEYGDPLIEGLFKAYSSILRGIKDPISGFKVIAALMEFSEAVCKEQRRRNTSVVQAGVGALSDLQSIVGSWIEDMIQSQSAAMEVDATN